MSNILEILGLKKQPTPEQGLTLETVKADSEKILSQAITSRNISADNPSVNLLTSQKPIIVDGHIFTEIVINHDLGQEGMYIETKLENGIDICTSFFKGENNQFYYFGLQIKDTNKETGWRNPINKATEQKILEATNLALKQLLSAD